MNTFLIILLVILMVLVVASLIRGIVAFMKSTKIDLESGEQTDATDMQLTQNKMMFARIKYQALAVVLGAGKIADNMNLRFDFRLSPTLTHARMDRAVAKWPCIMLATSLTSCLMLSRRSACRHM